jgi:hypothetical protein
MPERRAPNSPMRALPQRGAAAAPATTARPAGTGTHGNFRPY